MVWTNRLFKKIIPSLGSLGATVHISTNSALMMQHSNSFLVHHVIDCTRIPGGNDKELMGKLVEIS